MDPKEKIIDELIRDISHIRNEHIRSLGIILKLTEIAAKNLSLNDFCKEIIEVVIQETDFDNASIMLYDEESDALRLIAASGNTSVIVIDYDQVEEINFNIRLSFSRDNSIAWKVFESQEPYFVEDVYTNPAFKKTETTVNISSLFCLPLGEKGVLNLSTSIPKKLSTYQKRDLIIISQLIQKLLSLNNFVERLRSSHLLIQSLIQGKKLDLRQISHKDIDNFWGLESALLCAPQGIALIEDNIITLVNPSLISLLNEKSELVGKDIHHTCLSHIFQSLLDEEQLDLIHQKEFQLNIHPDKIIFVEAFLHQLTRINATKKTYLLFLHDITHQKEITKKLIEFEKKEIFSELSSGFAHHFNNILAVLVANIEMAMRDTDLDTIKKRLRKLIEPIGYAQHLIKNIQLITSNPNIDVEDISVVTDVNALIDEIISITSVKWLDEAHKLGKTIEIEKDVKENAALKINPDHLRNVLVNLIINSVDAIQNNGKITVRFTTKDQMGIIDVIDNGIGISEDEIDKIFSPFYTTKGTKSSGLGLTVSKELVKGYGGDLVVKSKKNVGTTATVMIPIHNMKVDQTITFAVSDTTKKDKKDIKILYVDDEEGIVDTITEMFSLDGFNIVSTTSSQEAINIINEHSIDILITDLGMPVINGYELAHYCREKNPHCYTILATGWGHQVDEDYKSRGIDTVLPKPYKYNELKEKILNSGKLK